MIDGSGNLGVSMGVGGLSLADNRRHVRLFKIASGSNPYVADEVWLNEASGATAVTGVYSIASGNNLLWEVNGNTSVPANTVVEAVPNPAGNGFWFTWQASAVVTNLLTWSANTNDLTSTVNGVSSTASVDLYVNSSTPGASSITSTTGVWALPSPAFSLTAPASGTYIFLVNMRVSLETTGGWGKISARLLINGSLVASTERLVAYAPDGVRVEKTTCMTWPAVTAGAHSIYLEVMRQTSGTFVESEILSDSDGVNQVHLIKIR